MAVVAPYPDFNEIMVLIGEAGRRLAEIEASEGAAGNISVYVGWPLDPRRQMPMQEKITLPEAFPELSGKCFIVSGSGRRLREIKDNPPANLAFVQVDVGGSTATLFSAPGRLFANPTSEFNSHLAVHRDQILATNTNFHAVIHAQPVHLTYLSHIKRYQNTSYLNQRILRWQPEMIVQLPEGLGHIPFAIPGSAELMAATIQGLRDHRIVLWGKHGVMARSDQSVMRACDRIEYAEIGARYEFMDLQAGGEAEGLAPEDVKRICAAFDIHQSVF
ncbi:MAG: class II aldolase/adducin family protein [Armatimonadota bacterium]